ncbi:MAG: hypothetical protein WCW56_03125 [Candidatus Paceibacterota bacterium]|jgi:hypothetical protein
MSFFNKKIFFVFLVLFLVMIGIYFFSGTATNATSNSIQIGICLPEITGPISKPVPSTKCFISNVTPSKLNIKWDLSSAGGGSKSNCRVQCRDSYDDSCGVGNSKDNNGFLINTIIPSLKPVDSISLPVAGISTDQTYNIDCNFINSQGIQTGSATSHKINFVSCPAPAIEPVSTGKRLNSSKPETALIYEGRLGTDPQDGNYLLAKEMADVISALFNKMRENEMANGRCTPFSFDLGGCKILVGNNSRGTWRQGETGSVCRQEAMYGNYKTHGAGLAIDINCAKAGPNGTLIADQLIDRLVKAGAKSYGLHIVREVTPGEKACNQTTGNSALVHIDLCHATHKTGSAATINKDCKESLMP